MGHETPTPEGMGLRDRDDPYREIFACGEREKFSIRVLAFSPKRVSFLPQGTA